MIVEAFKESLETGLEEPGQTVVRIELCLNYLARPCFHFLNVKVGTWSYPWPGSRTIPFGYLSPITQTYTLNNICSAHDSHFCLRLANR